ncbi:MAG: hypothetical protein AB9819_04295 [Methanomassiliicoccales archaeon]
MAEAPPCDESRFFYYTDVGDHDSLFIETMDVIFGDQYPDLFRGEKRKTNDIRVRKKEFLELFAQEGFYLIDAVDKPITRGEDDFKVVATGVPELAERINGLVSVGTRIVLIKASVYAIKGDLESRGVRGIINEEMIPFPGSGQQKEFRKRFRHLLTSADR